MHCSEGNTLSASLFRHTRESTRGQAAQRWAHYQESLITWLNGILQSEIASLETTRSALSMHNRSLHFMVALLKHTSPQVFINCVLLSPPRGGNAERGLSCLHHFLCMAQLPRPAAPTGLSTNNISGLTNHENNSDNDSCVFFKLCTDALKSGWTKFKVKVGADLQDDIRRCRLIRKMIGPENTLVMLVSPNQLYLH